MSRIGRLADFPHLGWLVGLGTVMLLALLAFSSYAAAAPLIRAEWALNNTQVGVLFSIYLIGYALSALVVVPLTDRIAPSRILLAALSLMLAGNLAFPLLAVDFWSGLVFRFLAGAGHVGVYMPAIRLISQRYPGAQRGAAVSLFVAAGYGGTTLSYTLTGLLLNVRPWREAYLGAALLGLLALLLAYRLLRDAHDTPVQTTASGRGRLDLTVLRDRGVALVVAVYALHTAELYLARLWFPLLLGALFMQIGTDVAAATARAATLSGFMFMTGMVAVFSGGLVSDRLGRTYGGALVFAVSGACSLLAGWLLGAPPWALITLGFVYGLATAADSAIYLTATVELAPEDRIGSVQAVESFIGFVAGALVPVIAGGILDTGDDWRRWVLAFSFNGLLAILGIAALYALRRLPQADQDGRWQTLAQQTGRRFCPGAISRLPSRKLGPSPYRPHNSQSAHDDRHRRCASPGRASSVPASQRSPA